MKMDKHTKSSRLILLKFILPILGVCLVAGAAIFGVYYVDYKLPAFNPDNKMVKDVNFDAQKQHLKDFACIKITDQTSREDLMNQVNEHLHPKWPSSFKRVINRELGTHSMEPGFYAISGDASATYFARAVTRGWQTPVMLTISAPIRSLDTLAARIASQMMVDEQDMKMAFSDPLLMTKFHVTNPEQWFQYILPDSYEVYWSLSVEEILQRLKNEWSAYWTKERQNLARQIGLTPEQVAIMASIVSEESTKPEEYPQIASVYLNRFRRGMKLQADPTICYIHKYSIRRVLKKHLEVESPYNTYLHEGLPPTPICLPSKEHIDAVLHADKTPYIYFCASDKMDGSHVFAVSYSDHMLNAARFHEALNALAAKAKQKANE